MELLKNNNLNVQTLRVWKSMNARIEGTWFCRNEILGDTYTTNSVGEVRDLIADNTKLSLREIAELVAYIDEGKLHQVAFVLSNDDDDYEGND